jgi:hypothetical protein
MEALSRVKELFPNLAGISSGEIAALFERFDERTRDDAGSSEHLRLAKGERARRMRAGSACPSLRWRIRRTGWAWWTGRHLPPPRASPAAEDLTFFSSCSHGLVSSQSVSYQARLCLHIEYTI